MFGQNQSNRSRDMLQSIKKIEKDNIKNNNCYGAIKKN